MIEYFITSIGQVQLNREDCWLIHGRVMVMLINWQLLIQQMTQSKAHYLILKPLDESRGGQ